MVLHRPAPVFLAALVALGISVPTADAGSKRYDCGNYPVLVDEDTDEYGWGFEELDGAGIWGVVGRGVKCADARRVALRASPENSFRGWKCRYLKQGYEYAKVRCSRPSGRTVSWETGA